jgi:drug/metabolite transporter (DMT)-like permease
MKNKNLNLYMNILKAVLIAVGVLLCLFLFGGPNVTTDSKEVVAEFRDGSKMGLASLFTAFVFFLCVGVIIIFFIAQLISNPKKTIISILGILAFLVIYLIFYFAGTSDTNDTLQLRNPVGQGSILTTTAGLYTTFVAMVIAFLAVLMGFFTRLKR